jgi:selenide,water dikinase
VYKISEDLALIQTVDFFTPIVDDPYWFGQIAAANALSDVYAMGGIPKTAMNLVAFPVKALDVSVLRQAIQGGIDKLREAEVVLIGGHSVDDKEFKYGLSVTGFVHPDHVITKKHLKIGDQLILTKPIGTGIINTAIKGGIASARVIEDVTRLMATLNRDAAAVMKNFSVSACTDITGFGLLGHLAEMIIDSQVGIQLLAEKIPVISVALEYAGMGFMPGGLDKNRAHRKAMVEIQAPVDQLLQDILYDPQTSGGLLISVDAGSASLLLEALKRKGVEQAAIIGCVMAEPKRKIIIR